MKNKWRVSGSRWRTSETSTEAEALEPKIYKLEADIFGLYLNQLEEKFALPEKIYGSDKNLVDRVYRTYHATTGNLGILLNGLKGTGKSLTSMLICNRMELPIIIIDNSYNGATANFIAEIPDDVVLFFDEYEKNFSTKETDDDGNPIPKDHSLLSVMDGALNTSARKIFLLTTNSPDVNENMLQRPGRVRYYKTFRDLNKELIIEIVEDKLLNKDLAKCTIEFISGLSIITMDIVNAVIDEVNIHDEDPVNFKDVFNVVEKDDSYNVYRLLPNGNAEFFKGKCEVSPNEVSKEYIGTQFYVGRKNLGTIMDVVNEGGDEEGYKVLNGNKEVWQLTEEEKKKATYTTFIIEKTRGLHSSFADYAY